MPPPSERRRGVSFEGPHSTPARARDDRNPARRSRGGLPRGGQVRWPAARDAGIGAVQAEVSRPPAPPARPPRTAASHPPRPAPPRRCAIERIREQNAKLKEELLLENKFSVRSSNQEAANLIAKLQDDADQLTRKVGAAAGAKLCPACACPAARRGAARAATPPARLPGQPSRPACACRPRTLPRAQIQLERRKGLMLDQQEQEQSSQLSATRQRMGSITAAREQVQAAQKQITLLENRLDKCFVRFNEAATLNKQLRAQIDGLRRERLMFEALDATLQVRRGAARRLPFTRRRRWAPDGWSAAGPGGAPAQPAAPSLSRPAARPGCSPLPAEGAAEVQGGDGRAHTGRQRHARRQGDSAG
jgi:hypothetical protein